MRSPSVLRKRAESVLEKVGEEILDASGDEMSYADYNFDLLRQHYHGSDFESESDAICNLLELMSKKMDLRNHMGVIMGVKGLLSNENGVLPDFMKYDEFLSYMPQVIGETKKEATTVPMSPYSANSLSPTYEESKDVKEKVPDISNAQAKVIEAEQYLEGTGLSSREKWQKYLADARKMAAVGDDSFDATPELDRDDIEYLRERERVRRQKELFESMVGGKSGRENPRV